MCNVCGMATGMDFKLRRIRVRKSQETVARIVRKSRSWVAKVEAIRGEVPATPAAIYDAVLRTFEDVSNEAVA